jgi:hypothetical protein
MAEFTSISDSVKAYRSVLIIWALQITNIEARGMAFSSGTVSFGFLYLPFILYFWLFFVFSQNKFQYASPYNFLSFRASFKCRQNQKKKEGKKRREAPIVIDDCHKFPYTRNGRYRFLKVIFNRRIPYYDRRLSFSGAKRSLIYELFRTRQMHYICVGLGNKFRFIKFVGFSLLRVALLCRT